MFKFIISYSEMGMTPAYVVLIILFGSFFLISFYLGSKNGDAKGVMNWMLKKPDDWIGNKK